MDSNKNTIISNTLNKIESAHLYVVFVFETIELQQTALTFEYALALSIMYFSNASIYIY